MADCIFKPEAPVLLHVWTDLFQIAQTGRIAAGNSKEAPES